MLVLTSSPIEAKSYPSLAILFLGDRKAVKNNICFFKFVKMTNIKLTVFFIGKSCWKINFFDSIELSGGHLHFYTNFLTRENVVLYKYFKNAKL